MLSVMYALHASVWTFIHALIIWLCVGKCDNVILILVMYSLCRMSKSTTCLL